MISKLTYLLSFYLIPLLCFSQDAQMDSMKRLVALKKEDTVTVNTYISMSKKLGTPSPDQAINYGNQGYELAKKIDFLPGQAYALKSIAIAYYNKGSYEQSLENNESSLAIFDSIRDKRGSANILSNIGAVYFAQADNIKALDYFLKALRIAEEIGDKQRTATVQLNIGNIYSNNLNTTDDAVQYYRKALPLTQELGDDYLIGTISVNLGEMYMRKNNLDSAEAIFRIALKASQKTEDSAQLVPYVINNIGKVYAKRKDFSTALKYQQDALKMAKKTDGKLDVAKTMISIADTYFAMGNNNSALDYYKQADTLAKMISANQQLKDAYEGLYRTYAALNDYKNAFTYQALFGTIKDTVNEDASTKQIARMQFDFKIQKKEAQVDLLEKDKALQQLELKRQKIAQYALIGGLALAFIIAIIIYRNYRNKIRVNKILDSQKAEIEKLLLNILPADVAQELQKNGFATARYYEKASVLFTDIKSFSKLADSLSPQEVVTELNDYFVAFDDIVGKYNLEKIKTIGDSYMCAGGIPTADDNHIINIIKASIEMQQFVKQKNANRMALGLPPWDIRIGINTGPIVAGVVGSKKYAYDIWGGTVNVASRMESNGEPGRVNISAATYELIKHQYACTHRGKIFAKNIGEIDMYFVDAELN